MLDLGQICKVLYWWILHYGQDTMDSDMMLSVLKEQCLSSGLQKRLTFQPYW